MDGEKYISVRDFSLKYTVESAQPLTFYGDIESGGNAVSFVSGSTKVFVRQKGRKLYFRRIGSASAGSVEKELRRRFGLDHDMRRIYESIDTDPFMHSAIEKYRGMRVTLNDPWETALSFVVSQFNNVKRIRGIMKCMISRFGEQVKYGTSGVAFNKFPSYQALAEASVSDLMRCGAGFRAKYIKEMAAELSAGFSLREIRGMSYERAKERLMELKGIGDKVADCILLMGYGKLEAFPIDTWVKRIVEHVYFNGGKKSVKEIHAFAQEMWGKHAGYAQQYLFWHGREAKVGKRGQASVAATEK